MKNCYKRLTHHARLTLIVTIIVGGSLFAWAGDNNWVLGKWKMRFDPEGSATDYLEFLTNGDVVNISHDGARVDGMYVVSDDRITTVFSKNGKDVIATFFFDAQHTTLRIVTGKSGQETLYQKQPMPTPSP
ncbi:MAG: hypothetical protein HY080_14760 [Gammaproteobacteria bacterium]|nr:hypothetical protein [Gammaproteobacteria bacterium]